LLPEATTIHADILHLALARITTSDGHSIPWTDEIRYLSSQKFHSQ